MFRLAIVILLAVSAHARTPEEIKRWFMQIGLECSNDYPVTPEQMQMLHRHKIPESKNVKCLIACVLKKPGWLTSEGMVDFAKTEATINEDFANNPEWKTNAKKVIDACRTVNDETVTDGAAGCERAYLYAQCLIKYAPEHGFDLKHVHL